MGSIETMDIDQIDSQLGRPRMLNQVDLSKVQPRGHTKFYVDLAARYQEPSTFAFERTLHGSESHPMLDTLSKTSVSVGELRKSRSYKELSDWEHFCMTEI